MKSKTSFFNATVFWNIVKRFWPIFAAYFVTWFISVPMSLNSALNWLAETGETSDMPITAATHVMSGTGSLVPIMTAAFALLFAMAAFSYLYNAKSVSMMCSLPIKREGIFLSVFTTGLAGMLMSNVIIFLITWAVEAAYGAVMMTYLWQWLAIVTLCSLFFYGLAVLCASFTGNILVLPCVYLVLNFTVAVVEYCVRMVLSGVYFGINTSSQITLGVFSPMYKLVVDGGSQYDFNVSGDLTGFTYGLWLPLIIFGLVGIAFSVCAMLLIKHRRMESAGDVVAVSPLKPVFKYCLTLGCALVIGVIINWVIFYNIDNPVKDGTAILIACMIFGAFIGYFAAEMLISRTLKVFRGRVWTGFAVSCLVILAFMLSCSFDVFGFEHRIPDVSEVKSVSVTANYSERLELSEAENIEAIIELHRSIVDNKQLYREFSVVVDSTDPDVYNDYAYWAYDYGYYGSYGSVQVEIDYNLKNGKVLSRRYTLYSAVKADDIQKLSDIVNSKEAVADRKKLNIAVTAENVSYGTITYYDAEKNEYNNFELTPEETIDLYTNCVLPDISSGALGNIWLDNLVKVNDLSYKEAVTNCLFNFELSKRVDTGDYNYEYFETTVTVNADNTIAWLEAHGIEPIAANTQLTGTKTSDNQAKLVDEGK